MREIKFRAWDGTKMYNNVTFRATDNGIITHIIGFSGMGMPTHKPIKNIIQFTGLKDKNDKEIYEGDIVFSDLTDWSYSVVWDKDDAQFRTSRGNNNKSFLYPKTSVVVGNIYENPELVKE